MRKGLMITLKCEACGSRKSIVCIAETIKSIKDTITNPICDCGRKDLPITSIKFCEEILEIYPIIEFPPKIIKGDEHAN